MKKILTVLLIAVLAAGMVFAAELEGNATLDFGYNLDNTDWGFKNGTDLTAKFSFNVGKGAPGSKGEGDIWAEIVGSFTVDIKVPKTTGASALTPVPALSSKFEIKEANVHVGEDLVFGILSAGGGYSYAASYWLDDDGDPVVNAVKLGKNLAPGFNVTYKGFKGGFGANGNADAKTYKFFGHVATPDFEVAEGVKVKAAGYGYLADNDKAAGAAAKASYEADELKASVGVDFVAEAKNDLRVEAALNAAYAPFTLDVFYNNYGSPKSDLNAKLAFAEGDYEAWVDGRFILQNTRTLEVGGSAKFDAIKAELKAMYAFATKALDVTPKVTYTADMFEVYGKVTLGLDLDASEKLTALKPELGVSSKTLINNATVSLKWTDSNFVKNAAGDPTALGKVTAQVKIAF